MLVPHLELRTGSTQLNVVHQDALGRRVSPRREPELKAGAKGSSNPGDQLARSSAELWGPGRGLSLGDRACLALAVSVDGVALTADHRWVDARLDVQVELIRA